MLSQSGCYMYYISISYRRKQKNFNKYCIFFLISPYIVKTKRTIYRYHDDPYLIPLSNYRKRAYALAAEAGRKAAIWIRDEHADLFTTRIWDPPLRKKTPYYNADPKIEAFSPKPIYNDESKVR